MLCIAHPARLIVVTRGVFWTSRRKRLKSYGVGSKYQLDVESSRPGVSPGNYSSEINSPSENASSSKASLTASAASRWDLPSMTLLAWPR